MPFSEEVKSKIRKKSHFSCCLCHGLGVEIHHIISQAENGPDTEDNAAPLCPSCHETYGANPTKRKFLREARDFWYELCAQRYVSDPDALASITERLDQTASKSDLQSLEKIIKDLFNSKPADSKLTSVELPDKYWVVVLAALEPQMKLVARKIEELKKEGYTFENKDDIPQEIVTAIVGTMFARGTIVDALVESGAMRPEAGARVGARSIRESVDETVRQYNQQKSSKDSS